MLLKSEVSLQALNMPSAITGIIQGVIIFFVLGSEFFINYRISLRKSVKEG